jgi:hypothetical protein
MQNGGVDIMDIHRAGGHAVTELIGLAVASSLSDLGGRIIFGKV